MAADQYPRRKQINDLQGQAQLQPAAVGVDSYARPGQQDVGRPLQTNPLMKLADSLSSIQGDLVQYGTQQAQKYISNEEAIGAQQALDMGREKTNAMIKAGEIPVGASPYAARGFQRAALKQAGEEYLSQTFQSFNSTEGDAARESNNPADMRKFLDGAYSKFSKEWLSGGKLNPLDVSEVLHPAIQQADAQLMRAHADYRVKRVEQDYKDLVSARSETILDDEMGKLTYATSQEDRDAAIGRAVKRMQDLRDNPDTGFVPSTGLAKVGGDLLVDAVLNKAMKTGDRGYLEVLDRLTTRDGAGLGKTQENQKKVLQAEEHITTKSLQEEAHSWQLEQRPYQRAALERQPKEQAMQDQRWEQERQSWMEHDAGVAEKEIYNSLQRRLYQGLDHPDSKKGVAIINEVLRQAKQSLPGKVEELNGILQAVTQRRAHSVDDPQTVSDIYLSMGRDPLGFKDATLWAAVRQGNLTVSTARGIVDDLDRKRSNASHPLMRQPEIHEMLKQVEKGALQSPEDEFRAEGQVRASQAVTAFRDEAEAWIAKNPQGNAAEFRRYMSKQIRPILEEVNNEYGKEQRAGRAKKEAEGRAIVENTQALVQKRDQILAERKAKEAAANKVIADREQFNTDYRPTGEKTKEGKTVLKNAKGEVATEGLITIKGIPEINHGGITNIPTIFNGKKVSDDDAIEIMKKSGGVDPENGKKAKRWYSISDAQIAARESTARDAKAFTRDPNPAKQSK